MEVGAWNNRAHHLGMYQYQPYQTHTHSGEEDLWEYFPCPFCYIEVEVPFLSSHLQEEHCFDFKNAVCPMCADTPGKDMISHFTIQHSHQIKRRKSHRLSLWNQNSSTVYEDSFSEMAPKRGTVYETESAADPLLSQFICTVAPINSDLGNVNHTSEMISVSSHDKRLVAAHAVENLGEEDLEERLQRVDFVRQMLVSTIF